MDFSFRSLLATGALCRRYITPALLSLCPPLYNPLLQTPWLDGKHVVFGRVLDEESMAIVKLVESKGSSSGATSATLEILDSGELTLEEVAELLPKEDE